MSPPEYWIRSRFVTPVLEPADLVHFDLTTFYDAGPAAACGGGNCLVAWNSSSEARLAGRRISPSGTLLDADEILLPPSDWPPELAFGASTYLVVSGAGNTVRGARVGTDGVVLDPDGFPIHEGIHPVVASDGTSFLVLWMEWVSPDWDLCGAEVLPDASVGERFCLGSIPEYTALPDLTFGGSRYLTVFERVRQDTGGVYGAFVDTASCTDVDGDGYGDPVSPTCTFSKPDCDDGDPDIHPGVSEDCGNGADDDCDGCVDLGDPDCWECTSDPECDDENPCTDDACTEGFCVHTNNSVPCDDGDVCTMDDVCSEGICTPGEPSDKDDDSYVDGACGGEDCDDDPVDDPPECDTCSCGEPACGGCAACQHPGAPDFPGDGFDSDCDGETPPWTAGGMEASLTGSKGRSVGLNVLALLLVPALAILLRRRRGA